MRRSFWKIWTKTNTKKKALEVFLRLLKRAGRTAEVLSVELYPKIDGHVIRFTIYLESETWNDQIVEIIGIGQSIAHDWSLTGSISSDPGESSSKVCDSGVAGIEWSFQ